MTNKPLKEQHCQACQGLEGTLPLNELQEWMGLIDSDWQLSNDKKTISRAIRCKNFSKVMFLVNATAHMADQEGHHPDVSFGYNQVAVSYTTHEADGLTRNDFICAKKVDGLITS